MLLTDVCVVVLVIIAVAKLQIRGVQLRLLATIETNGRLMELQNACWINSHKIPPKAGMEG